MVLVDFDAATRCPHKRPLRSYNSNIVVGIQTSGSAKTSGHWKHSHTCCVYLVTTGWVVYKQFGVR